MNLVKEPLLKLDPGVLCKWEEWNVYLDEYAQLRVQYAARVLEKPLPEHLRDIAISQVDLKRSFLTVSDETETHIGEEPATLMFAWRTFHVSAPACRLGELIDDLRSGAIYTKLEERIE